MPRKYTQCPTRPLSITARMAAATVVNIASHVRPNIYLRTIDPSDNRLTDDNRCFHPPDLIPASMITPLFFLPCLLPLTLAMPASNDKAPATGVTYCTGENLTGNCTYFASVTTSSACRKLTAGKGSFNVYPYQGCLLYDDDACASATYATLGATPEGQYVHSVAAVKVGGKSYAWKTWWCGTLS